MKSAFTRHGKRKIEIHRAFLDKRGENALDLFNKTDPILEAVAERDIDILIVEEFCVSEIFQRFLFDKVSSVVGALSLEDVEKVKPKHSVSSTLRKADGPDGVFYENRETDIEIRFIFRDTAVPEMVLFIEDKVDSPFTKEQAESYLARVKQARVEGKTAASMLVAPQAYINTRGNPEYFDFFLSFEEIEPYFDSRIGQVQGMQELESRYQFKKMLLEQAIEKWRRKGETKVNEDVMSFRRDYDKRVIEKAPQLKHDPVVTIGDDIWVEFYKCLDGGRKNVRWIIHKTKEGKVDLHVKVPELYSRWHEIKLKIEPLLEPGMQLPPPGKKDQPSFKVSLDAPVLNPLMPITEEKLPDVDRVIEVLDRLRLWNNRNRKTLEALQV